MQSVVFIFLKKMRRKIIFLKKVGLFLSIATMILLLMSFNVVDPCLKEVRAVFDRMNETTASGKVFHLNYGIKAVLNEKDKQEKNIISASSIEMLTSNKYSWILSEQMKVYKDNINTITVLPQRKLIYLSDAVMGAKDENMYTKLKQLQDTIFKNSEKVECVNVTGQLYNKTVTLFLNSKISQALEMKKVTYYINSTENTLQRVFVEYIPNKQYKTLDYVFTDADFDYTKVNIAVPVEQLLYSGKGLLKQEYKGYEVIENRKKSYKK